MFAIIIFLEEGTVDYVPEIWLIGRTQCAYPPTNAFIAKKKCSAPLESWKIYDVRILSYAG
jgi:hypothetical protein